MGSTVGSSHCPSVRGSNNLQKSMEAQSLSHRLFPTHPQSSSIPTGSAPFPASLSWFQPGLCPCLQPWAVSQPRAVSHSHSVHCHVPVHCHIPIPHCHIPIPALSHSPPCTVTFPLCWTPHWIKRISCLCAAQEGPWCRALQKSSSSSLQAQPLRGLGRSTGCPGLC